MTAAQEDLVRARSEFHEIDTPRVEDGAAIWRIARDSEVLDLNSSYSYLLWCRDFAATSVVARDTAGAPIGFVTGYVRPDRPEALVVWQVAVDQAYRGLGLAGVLLDGLIAKVTARGWSGSWKPPFLRTTPRPTACSARSQSVTGRQWNVKCSSTADCSPKGRTSRKCCTASAPSRPD